MSLNENLVTSRQRYAFRGHHGKGPYEVLQYLDEVFHEVAFLVLIFLIQDKICLKKVYLSIQNGLMNIWNRQVHKPN